MWVCWTMNTTNQNIFSLELDRKRTKLKIYDIQQLESHQTNFIVLTTKFDTTDKICFWFRQTKLQNSHRQWHIDVLASNRLLWNFYLFSFCVENYVVNTLHTDNTWDSQKLCVTVHSTQTSNPLEYLLFAFLIRSVFTLQTVFISIVVVALLFFI